MMVYRRFLCSLVLVLALTIILPPAGAVAAEAKGTPPAGDEPGYPPVADYRLPKKITICGERIPIEQQDVYESMDYEFLLAAHTRPQVFLWMRRGARYFPHIEKRLKEEGLPDDLKYLAVAESDLRPWARSVSKALGVWQFMDFTGKRFGLRSDESFDERYNFERSTEAAIAYLKFLKEMFGKWTLAMAAYNCGEGCVGNAIRDQEIDDYFRLYLPNETERYVYRIAAIKIILENPAKYGYTMSPEQAYQPLNRDVVEVSLASPVHFTRAAKAIGSDYKMLRDLNPEIQGSYLPRGNYRIYTPAGTGAKLKQFLTQPAPASATPAAATAAPPETEAAKAVETATAQNYVVKRGDTLAAISRQTGVALETLRKLNNIQGNQLMVGQRLKLVP